MARRRQATNQSKAKTESTAPARASEPAASPRQPLRWLGMLALAGACVAMLLAAFAPVDQWYLAYVALVPWCLVLAMCTRMRSALAWSLAAGAAFWFIGLYFIQWVDNVGYAALCLYLSMYWVAAGAVVHAAVKRRWSLTLVLPLVWVGLEFVRAYLISGFPWDTLALSQYRRIRLIQIADATSTYGVSFFVAMVNGLIVDAVLMLRRSETRSAWIAKVTKPAAATALVLAGLLGYGTYRLNERTTSPGPSIGIVQQAYPISLAGQSVPQERIFQTHLDASKEFLGADVELVLWPETMGSKGINPEVLDLDVNTLKRNDLRSFANHLVGLKYIEANLGKPLSDNVVRSILRQNIDGRDERGRALRDPDTGEPYEDPIPSLRWQVRELGRMSRELGCPLLIGACAVDRNPKPINADDGYATFNSAMLFDGSGRATRQYAKVHLVPFGEYVPFKDSWLGLHKFLRSFVPDVMSQIEPGRQNVVFELPRRAGVAGSPSSAAMQATKPATNPGAKPYRIATPICYEGVFANVCRKMVMQDMTSSDGRHATRKVDILANMSNDGWFARNGTGSTEQPQHLTQYVFRAIESRVPVVRAVNTGISGSIDSSGRIVATVRRGNKQTMVQGTLLLDGKAGEGKYADGHGPRVMLDSRTTLYGRIGDIFGMLCAAGGLAVVATLVVRRKSSNPKG